MNGWASTTSGFNHPYDEVIARAIDLGGAASGEHGVGVGKIKHVCWEHGPFHVAGSSTHSLIVLS